MSHWGRLILISLAVIPNVVINGCTTAKSPLLSDQLTTIPVSSKQDRASGLSLIYVHGTNQGILTGVTCNKNQTCLFSGNLGSLGHEIGKIDAMLFRLNAKGGISWAHNYLIKDIYTSSNGLVYMHNGSTLLYGNAAIPSDYRIGLFPTYEKIDENGQPAWGGVLKVPKIKPWSAFSDAIRLKSGGYLLAGSTYLFKTHWYGFVIKIDSSGQRQWVYQLASTGSTFIQYVTQLANNKILAVGVDTDSNDIEFFYMSENGKLLKSLLIRMPGSEVPVGIATLADEIDVAAYQKMPNNEAAAIILILGKDGVVKGAERFQYIDGFIPNSITAMSKNAVCLYGATTANEKKQSLAFVLSNKKPVAALTLQDRGAFRAGTPYRPGVLLFAGARPLGVDQHMTPLITRWEPSVKNDKKALKNISTIALDVETQTNTNTQSMHWDAVKSEILKPAEMLSSTIYKLPEVHAPPKASSASGNKTSSRSD